MLLACVCGSIDEGVFVQAMVRSTIGTRLAMLLGTLAVVAAAWIYDYSFAQTGVEGAEKQVDELVNARVRRGVNEVVRVTATDIHQAIRRTPTWVDKHVDDHYEVEYYCWWGRVPLLNMRRHYLAIVYVGDEPRRYSSHHRNERPPREALPMPFLNKPAQVAAADSDAHLPFKDRPHLRRPVAAAWIERDKLLAIANQRSGSISIVDIPKSKVLDEIVVGKRLTDIVADPLGRWLLATDEQEHELIVLKREGDSLRVAGRHRVSPYPVSIAVSKSGERISVASLWSRKLTIFECLRESNVVIRGAEISLPFNPRALFFNSDESVLVHDAFANRGCEFNTRKRMITRHIEPTYVSVSPQRYGGPANDMDWHIKGVIMWSNINDGQEMISGGQMSITLGPVPRQTPEERGEELFYGRGLSSVIGKNCHDCHTHGHTTYELADTLGDETTGTPKRIPTLLGTSLTYPWAWNGSVSELDDQVKKSLETTMHVRDVTPQQVIDINAFLHTLAAPPPLQPATDDPADRAQLSRGQSLFTSLGCAKCHLPQFTYTSPDVYDVGLEDEKGMRKFNPPSLLGVGQGYSFFHDGRAKSLEEVFTVHGHQLDRALADGELADLLRFLRSL